MEFQEFWDNFNRMHNYCSRCDGCPISQKVCNTKNGSACALWCANHPIEAEKIVDQWVKEHPIVTNGQKFHKIMMETFGQVYLNRAIVADTSGGEHGISYTDDWWNAEYQPPKEEEG